MTSFPASSHVFVQTVKKFIYFFQAGTVTNPTIWLFLCAVRIFLSLTMVTVTLAWVFIREFFFCELGKKKVIYRHRVGPYSEKLWPRASFSRPRSQFFTIRTSQPANNIYILARFSKRFLTGCFLNMCLRYCNQEGAYFINMLQYRMSWCHLLLPLLLLCCRSYHGGRSSPFQAASSGRWV